MKSWLIIAFLLLSLPVFAITTYNPVIEDTFVTENASALIAGTANAGIIGFDNMGNVNMSSQRNYGDFNETVIFVLRFGSIATDVRSLWKFNNSIYQSKIIDDLEIVYDNAAFDCGQADFSAYWENDDSWLQNVVTFDTKPVLDTAQRLSGVNRTGSQNQLVIQDGALGGEVNSSELYFLNSFAQANANLLDDIYTDDQTTIYTDKTGGDCGSVVGSEYTLFSREEPDSSVVNISFKANLVDFTTAFINFTDTFPQDDKYYFDFEAATISASSFPQADFIYDISENTLTPIQPATSVNFDEEPSNTLSALNCGSFAPFSTSQISSFNVPAGEYDKVCFDLSNEHNGLQFYGAIKIIQNTDGGLGTSNFAFYYAMYSPELVTFSPATFNPNPPQEDKNLTISWTSSQNVTTGLRFRYDTGGGTMSSYVTLTDSASNLSHQVTIPANLMFPVFYEYQLFGTDGNATTFTTQVFNFTAFPIFATDQVSFAGSRVFFDFETGVSSASSITGMDFDINSTNNTLTSYAPRAFLTVEANSDNTLENVDCRLASPFTTGTNMQIQENSIFCYDLSSQHGGEEFFGAIKVTTISPSLIEFYWATYTPDAVTFFGIVKSPDPAQATRDLQIRWQTSIPMTSKLQYSYQKINETGYSSIRLIEETSAFRTNHALTIPANDMFVGDYRFFLQGDDSSNNSYTSNTFNFTVVNQSTVGSVANPIALFLGITTQQALNIISLIISLAVMFIAQWKLQSPPVTIVMFFTSLIVFIAIGWLELIFGIILTLIAIGIAVYFAQKIIFGSGG